MSLLDQYKVEKAEHIRGNRTAKVSLKTLLERDAEKLPKTILLAGPTGCGKTSSAKILAKHCTSYPFGSVYLNSASFRGVETIRNLEVDSKKLCRKGTRNVYILDECHQLTKDAQNAMLNLLEEDKAERSNSPVFVLCTTEPEKLLNTVLSRCFKIEFDLLNYKETCKFVKDVYEDQGYPAPSDEITTELYRQTEGSPRAILSIVDSIYDMSDEVAIKTINAIHKKEENKHLPTLLLEQDWEKVSAYLKDSKENPESIRANIIETLGKKQLFQNSDKIHNILDVFIDIECKLKGELIFCCRTACNL